MYKYKVVTVRLPFLGGDNAGAVKVQAEMNKHALEGWRVLQVSITDITMVIITFERPI